MTYSEKGEWEEEEITISNPNSSPTTPISLDPPKNTFTATDTAGELPEDWEDDQKDLRRPVPGWPKVALQMADTPDFAAFSRFRASNIKSLLYYQAEITKLQKKLHEQEWIDHRLGDEDAQDYAKCADVLIDSVKEGDGVQWRLVKDLRALLKEYNEALLLFTQLSALPEPENYNINTFRKWLRDPAAGHFCVAGNGEQHTWGHLYDNDEEEPHLVTQLFKVLWRLFWPKPPEKGNYDLVATQPSQKVDGFTRWVADEFVPFHHNFSKYKKRRKNPRSKDLEKVTGQSSLPRKKSKSKVEKTTQKTLVTYSDHAMLRFTSAFSTVIACLLPTIGITVLSKVHGTNNLLLCLAGFAAVFSVGLMFLTNAATARVEIFTATAAFSAVLVVFISAPPVVVVPS